MEGSRYVPTSDSPFDEAYDGWLHGVDWYGTVLGGYEMAEIARSKRSRYPDDELLEEFATKMEEPDWRSVQNDEGAAVMVKARDPDEPPTLMPRVWAVVRLEPDDEAPAAVTGGWEFDDPDEAERWAGEQRGAGMLAVVPLRRAL